MTDITEFQFNHCMIKSDSNKDVAEQQANFNSTIVRLREAANGQSVLIFYISSVLFKLPDFQLFM